MLLLIITVTTDSFIQPMHLTRLGVPLLTTVALITGWLWKWALPVCLRPSKVQKAEENLAAHRMKYIFFFSFGFLEIEVQWQVQKWWERRQLWLQLLQSIASVLRAPSCPRDPHVDTWNHWEVWMGAPICLGVCVGFSGAPSTFVSYFPFSFNSHFQGTWKFLGQGSNLNCSCGNVAAFKPLH